MNYRHAFHAGNFADVVKHSLLVALLQALNRKPAPWCYYDTHAGAGAYDLEGEAARRTHEAQGGILRLWPATGLPLAVAELKHVVAGLNADLPLAALPRRYPGSPAIAAALARSHDRLVLAELHPQEAAALKQHFRRDGRVAVHERNGYEMLQALTPPAEKRGLALLDPPFEQTDEFDALVEALVAVQQRWSTGIFALWYPLKDEPTTRRFLRKLEHSGLRKLLLTELRLPEAAGGLAGSGLVVANPPWQFDSEARACLAALSQVFGATSHEVRWLIPE